MTSKFQFVGEKVPFDEAFREVSRGVSRYKQAQYQAKGAHPIVDQGKEAIAGYSDDEEGLFADVPAIVFGDHTRNVKYIEEPFFVGADGVKILKPTLSTNVRYWYHALRAAKVEDLGYSRHFKLLKAKAFVNPSPEEQLRICSRLDAVLECISLMQAQQAKLDQLVKSRFVEMFGDPNDDCFRWRRLRLDAFCRIVTGNTPSRRRSEYFGDYIEWIKTDNITAAPILTRALEGLSEEGAKVGRIAPKGSILMACIAGSVNSIGKVAIADRDVAFNQQINAIVPDDKVLVEYLYWLFVSSKSYLCSDVNMQLKGILNKTTLSRKEFPLPPLALQQQFADFVAQVDKPRFVAQQQIEKLQMLYDSLAQDYFG